MVQTRGSDAIDKAQRRIALLTSIEESLDLGHGLTIEAYRAKIEAVRTKLEAHNRLKSDFDESCKVMRQEEKELLALSERMLSGVATKYGKTSVQYQKAGGKNRKRGSSSTQTSTSKTEEGKIEAIAELMQVSAQNGGTVVNN